MNPHPLIRAELARQRQLDLRRSSRRNPYATSRLTAVVRAAKRGDGQAWESLVESFTPTMRGVVRGYRLNPADVDDVIQFAWAVAFAQIDRLREPEALGGWLMVTARREALRTLERRRREVLVGEPCYADEADYSAVENALVEAEKRQAVHAAVERLPHRQRRLIRALMRDARESYADVSRKLDMPVGSIGPTRERALARLRSDRGLTALVGQEATR
jgi:RNA polymerase sigma factor (sigma-70 family)